MNNESSDLLYMQLKKTITDDILSGALKPGDKLLTTTEMAEKFKVCHRTVQRAMSVLSKEGLIIRRPHHGSFVAVPGSIRSNVPQGEQCVYVLLEVLDESFMSLFYIRDMLAGITSAASKYGHRVKLSSYSAIESIASDHSVGGLLLMCPTRDEAAAVKRLGIPAIQLDVKHPHLRLGVVKTHHADGTMQGIRHLVRLGHKKILYVHTDPAFPNNFCGKERFTAFQKACKLYDLPFENYTVIYHYFEERLKNGPEFSAVMTDGYGTTLIALDILRNNGISIPHGVSFVGYDDVELAEHMTVPITLIRQKLKEVGSTAMSLLFDKNEGWRDANVLIKPELVIRSSTMKYSDR